MFICHVLSSCFPFGFASEHVVGDYYVTTTDGDDAKQRLSRRVENDNYIGVVGHMVYAVWFNEKFLIVKQHPPVGEEKVDDKITYYYIVFVDNAASDKILYNDSVVGPLDDIMFELSVDELGIKEKIEFQEINL